MKPYEQSTSESCLTCSLFHLSDIPTNRKRELEMLFYAFKFSKEDWVAGHLNLLKKKYGVSTIRYVHNKGFYNSLKDQMTTTLRQEKVTLPFIDKNLEEGPVLLLVDAYLLDGEVHYPHWVVIHSKRKQSYHLYDPWNGKMSDIPARIIKEAIRSLGTRLWMAPQMIVVE